MNQIFNSIQMLNPIQIQVFNSLCEGLTPFRIAMFMQIIEPVLTSPKVLTSHQSKFLLPIYRHITANIDENRLYILRDEIRNGLSELIMDEFNKLSSMNITDALLTIKLNSPTSIVLTDVEIKNLTDEDKNSIDIEAELLGYISKQYIAGNIKPH